MILRGWLNPSPPRPGAFGATVRRGWTVFWLLFLPLKLAFCLTFGILLLPFLLLRLAIKAVVALVLLPFVLVIAVLGIFVAVLAFSFAVLVPLLPLAFVVCCVWAIVRVVSPPVIHGV
jgi:hypothetical protein